MTHNPLVCSVELAFNCGLALKASQLHFVRTDCIASALPLSSSSPKRSESRGSQRTRVGRLGPLPFSTCHRGPSLPCNPCQCCIPLIGQYASAQGGRPRPARDRLWARVLWNKRVLVEERKKEIKCTPGCDGRAYPRRRVGFAAGQPRSPGPIKLDKHRKAHRRMAKARYCAGGVLGAGRGFFLRRRGVE